MYRQTLEGHDLSVEEGTPSVPADGRYYVLFEGEVVGRFRSLAKALERYREIKKDLDLPNVAQSPLSPEELRRREMEAMSNKRLLWTDEDFARVERKTRGKKGTRSSG